MEGGNGSGWGNEGLRKNSAGGRGGRGTGGKGV